MSDNVFFSLYFLFHLLWFGYVCLCEFISFFFSFFFFLSLSLSLSLSHSLSLFLSLSLSLQVGPKLLFRAWKDSWIGGNDRKKRKKESKNKIKSFQSPSLKSSILTTTHHLLSFLSSFLLSSFTFPTQSSFTPSLSPSLSFPSSRLPVIVFITSSPFITSPSPQTRSIKAVCNPSVEPIIPCHKHHHPIP